MYLPKSDIYNALKTITGVTVRQASQKTTATIPSITFFIADNSANLTLDNEISHQDILVTIDIWAKDSAKADTLLSQVETNMRAIGYRLAFVLDVPDPEPQVCHVNTRFEGVIGN